MAQLEDLKPGYQVAGIVPDQPVTVVDVQWHGGDTVELFYKRQDGSTGTRLVFREEAVTYHVDAAPRTWHFTGDGARFRLVAEAYRIHLAHLFDPVLAVHTSLIEPLPHQITAVYGEMLMRQPLRYLLADDPGAGKTIMAGLLIKELMVRGDVRRCLICVPGNLAHQWQDELWFKFQLRLDVLTREMAESAVTGNVFQEKDLLIMRLDQVARSEDLLAQLGRSEWDLVVVDEAHKMSASFWGGELKVTMRYRLGELLGGISRHLLLMTATPHNGKEEDFQLFLQLIDPDRFAGRFRDGVHQVDVSDIMRRMVKENLMRFDGRPLFPERRAYTVDYPLSPAERQLYEAVTAYVREEFNRAEALLDDRRKGTVGFALMVLQRRLASSPEAIYRSLVRRRERLERRLKEVEAGRLLVDPADAVADMIVDEDYLDDLEDAPAAEAEEIEEWVLDSATAALTIVELQAEIETLHGLERLAFLVRQSGQDEKWNQLARLLQEEEEMMGAPASQQDGAGGAPGPPIRRKLVIFTEHRDTLVYLHQRISTLFGRDENIVHIHGSLGREQRREVEDRFRNDPTVHFLLATDAAGEGINLQRAHLMINYDLPWNPNRLEQRFGRIHRIGQTEVCHLWNLVAAETREGYVYRRLLSKLETESKALDGRVFDILGNLFHGTPLRRLLVEAVRYGDSPEVRDRLNRAVDNAVDREHVRELLEGHALLQETMDLSQIERIRADMERYAARRLQPHYIKTFFLEAFELLGGAAGEREPGRYAISYVPALVRNKAKEMGTAVPVLRAYERICFDKALIAVPGKPLAQFICPGHPLLDAVIHLILDQHQQLLRTGAILINPAGAGTEPSHLFFLQHTIRDATEHVISREVHFVEITASGETRVGGGAPYLDYRPPTGDEQRLLAGVVEEFAGELPETQAVAHAIAELVPRHLSRVRERREALIDKTTGAVQGRLTKEINYWDGRAAELRQREAEGGPAGRRRSERLNAAVAQQRADELAERLQRRKEALALQRQVSASAPVVVGGALVVPAGLLAQLAGCELPGGIDTRPVTEAIAMQAVMEKEVALGNSPRDVGKDNLGYDVESLDPATGRLRFIEVKGRRADADTITVTRNEILTAVNSAEQYILAIVRVDGGRAQSLHYVRRPFTQEPSFAVTSVNFDLHELLGQET
jgi:superfamily II DNA or RNA helicase